MIFPKPNPEVFTIYSKLDCLYCLRAKCILEWYNHDIVECDKYLENDRQRFLSDMQELTKYPVKTFPFIFYGDHYIGGYNELVQHLKSNSII